MSLYQKSVEKKYLNDLDPRVVEEKYTAYFNHFGNPVIQQNIKESKEEEYQEGFVRDLFVNILGYTLKPSPDYNLVLEQKNVDDSKKADGAIIRDKEVIAVIELKSTLTTDLDMVESQAFGYKNHHPKCSYVITSNFEKIRLYIQNAVEYEEFDLFNLTKDSFALLYLCLSKDSILRDLPLKIKESSVLQEENVTKKLYEDYSRFRAEIFDNIVKNNPRYDQLLLFRKTQKLLDRFLFIFFAEDRLLLPPNSISEIVKQWKTLKEELDAYVPLYDRFRKYFNYMNTGFKGKKYDIYPYNGGLFLPDDVLDNIKIDDEILHEHTIKLSAYDFETDIDVNILGHIFEHSIAEIENIQAKLRGEEIEKKKTKRKKEGIYYTPKYITKYIVENTVGKLCEEKRKELGIADEDYTPHRQKATKKKLLASLNKCREWLLGITICDPACGSGAFLNQALDFLIHEHHKLDELQANLLSESIVFSDIETDILERNLYGVDINDEAIEIAKLSLWLRTAKKGRKLSTLSNNIKVGNSLIDDPEVAGEKAFKWEEEFPDIFSKKEKRAWHITCATHNSRYSQRMFDNHVKLGEPVWLSEKEEHIVTEKIAEIVEEDKLNIPAYNICGDHMHILLVCEEKELPKIVEKLTQQGSMLPHGKAEGIEGTTTREHAPLSRSSTSTVEEPTGEHAPLSDTAPSSSDRGTTQTHLWTQKFGKKEIVSEKQLHNTIEYIRNNRQKHKLPNTNKKLQLLIDKMVCPPAHAFRTEYKGGFDVVIGNPPYVEIRKIESLVKNFFNKEYNQLNSFDLYSLFIEKSILIIKKDGIVSLIIPKPFIYNSTFEKIRSIVFQNCIEEIVFFDYDVFESASVESIIITFSKKNKVDFFNYSYNLEPAKKLPILKEYSDGMPIILDDKKIIDLLLKIQKNNTLEKITSIMRGLELGKRTLDRNDISFDNSVEVYAGEAIGRYIFDKSLIYYVNKNDLDKYIKKVEDTFIRYPRLLMRRVDADPICTIIEKGENIINNLNSIYNIASDKNYSKKYLLIILNSNLSKFFINKKFNSIEKIFPYIRIEQIKTLPIKKISIEAQQPSIEKADKMLKKNDELFLIQTQFVNFLLSKFDIDKLSKKLQTWYELEFKELLKELHKTRGCSPLLSLSEEAEWMQYFNNQKQKAQELKSEIDQTDKEIDQMVYDLYGLTEEEIRIVEEGVR